MTNIKDMLKKNKEDDALQQGEAREQPSYSQVQLTKLYDDWKQSICTKLECDKLAFFGYIQAFYSEEECMRPEDHEMFGKFFAIYDRVQRLCQHTTFEYPKQRLENVPAKEWMRKIIFPNEPQEPEQEEEPSNSATP